MKAIRQTVARTGGAALVLILLFSQAFAASLCAYATTLPEREEEPGQPSCCSGKPQKTVSAPTNLGAWGLGGCENRHCEDICGKDHERLADEVPGNPRVPKLAAVTATNRASADVTAGVSAFFSLPLPDIPQRRGAPVYLIECSLLC